MFSGQVPSHLLSVVVVDVVVDVVIMDAFEVFELGVSKTVKGGRGHMSE